VREVDTVDDAVARRGGSTRGAASSDFIRDGKKLGTDRIDLYTLRVVVSSRGTGIDCYRVFQYSSKASSL
jgi:hypothetical protein